MILPLILATTTLLGCAHRHASIDGIVGPETTSLPMYRSRPDGQRIYVEVDLGDGVPRFFLIDTGSSVTTITAEVAEELGLTVQDTGGWLQGVAGRARWKQSTLPEVSLGKFSIEEVKVAVDVEGVPVTAGAVPLAGLMGNNVWKNFQLSLDYVGGEMILARPGELALPASATPMHFDGQHISADITLQFETGDQTEEKPLTVLVDTGAGELLLAGHTVAGLSLIHI